MGPTNYQQTLVSSHGYDPYPRKTRESYLQIAYDYHQLGLVAYGTLVLVDNDYGLGVHQWNVPLDKVIKWAQVGQFWANVVMATKVGH